MDRRTVLTALPVAMTSIIAGCLGGDTGGDDATPTPTQAGETTTASMTTTNDSGSVATTIDMENFAFNPVKAEVETGATVQWVNRDSAGHDVTSEQFSSGAADWDFQESVSGGGSITYTFETAGAYEYSCTIHGESSMCGVVVVGGVSYDGDLPCQSSSTGDDSDDGYGY